MQSSTSIVPRLSANGSSSCIIDSEVENAFYKQNLRIGYTVKVLNCEGIIIGLDPLSLQEACIRFDLLGRSEEEKTFWIDINKIKVLYRFSDKIPAAVENIFQKGDWVNISDKFSCEEKAKFGQVEAIDHRFYESSKVLVKVGLTKVQSTSYINKQSLTAYHLMRRSFSTPTEELSIGSQVITTGGPGEIIGLDSKSSGSAKVQLGGKSGPIIWLNSRYLTIVPQIVKLTQDREILGLRAFMSDKKKVLEEYLRLVTKADL